MDEDTSKQPKKNSGPPIGLFDQYGRKLLIERAEWFTKFLQPALTKARENPEQLASLIANAIEQKYTEELEAISLHLLRIDPIPLRATCIRSAILLLSNRPQQAEGLLRQTLQREAAHPHLLTLLAKSLITQKKYQEVLPLLCRALSIDPNHEEALNLVLHIASETKKETLLEELSQHPKAVKPKIALAGRLLAKKDNETALEVLERAASTKKTTEEELASIGNLLNSQNLYLETLQVLGDRFNKKKHGITLGSPLTIALLEMGQVEDAKELLETLHKKKSPRWRDELQKLEDNLARASLEHPETLNPKTITLERLTIFGPLWLHQDPNAQELFEIKDPESPRFAVLPASVLAKKTEKAPRKEATNTSGRLSRILPLLLTEWIEMHTDCHAQTVIPWVSSEGAFALFQEEWKNDDASEWTREHSADQFNDYTITLNLTEDPQQWRLDITILNTLTQETEASFSINLSLDNLVEQLKKLRKLTIDKICHLGAQLQPNPKGYNPPEDPEAYLQYSIRLEQCLSCVCAAQDQKRPTQQTLLAGERDILQHGLLACLESPDSLPLRLTLLKTLAAVKKINPSAALEFQKPIQWLNKSSPLENPYQGVIKTKIKSLFPSKK